MDLGKRKRIRIRVAGATEAQKLKDAELIIKNVKDAFDSGAYISEHNRKLEETEAPELDFETVLNEYMSFRMYGLKERSKGTYKTWSNLVLAYFTERNLTKAFLGSIDKKTIRAFFDWILVTRKLSNKTYNDMIGFMSGLYNYHLERESVPQNLVVGFIKRRKVISGKHVPFTLEQARTIMKSFADNEDKQMGLFLSFCFYTLGRPRSELRGLKIADLDNLKVWFNPKNAKSTERSFVEMPYQLQDLIEEHRLYDYPRDFFVFGKNGEPSEKPTSLKFFYKKHKGILDELKYTDRDYSLYSWKHTAVIQLFLAGVDIETIRLQCRHSDISQTIQYLKDLGLIVNSGIMNNYPTL